MQEAARRLRAEQRGQSSGQFGLVEVAHDTGALHEADLTALLGDDHDDSIGLFRHAERGLVASSEPLERDRRLCRGQDRAGGEQAVASDDHGAVVEGRPGRKERDQHHVDDVVLANYGPQAAEIVTADAYVTMDDPGVPPARQWNLPPRSMKILRRSA